MRLLHIGEAQSLEFKEFDVDDIPKYAILSHRWKAEEVLFEDMQPGGSARSKAGYGKVKGFVKMAKARGFDYCWTDTCCTLQEHSSSAELSEAINSMFKWYQNATECYVYLADVPEVKWQQSEWWSRGWALQELLAPENVIFFDKKWTELGTKLQREKEISNITGIKRQVLGGLDCMEVPVNDKMRWASRRQTTRLEDQAYCLLGIFGINMPLLYGEGSRAFIRLQEEILRRGNDDPSLFIWRAKSAWKGPSKSVYHGLLAESPADFQEYRHLRLTSSPSSISSRGVQLRVRLKPFRRGVYQGVLACSEFKEGKKTGDVAIRLLHIPKDSNDARKAAISEDDIFVRINIDALDVIDPAEVQDKAEYLIQISNVTNAPGLTHKPGSSLPVSIERSSLLRFDVRQVFGLRYETNSPADTLYVKPATGKLVGYCLDSKTKGIPKPCVLTVVGLNWTGSPWCAVSHHNDAGEARKVYEKFDVGSTARPAVHESHDGYHVRGSVRLRHRNNRIRVWLLLEVIS